MEVKKAGNIGDTVPVLFFGKKIIWELLVLVSDSSAQHLCNTWKLLIIGNKSEMILLEKDFVNELFTPFQDDESG